MVTAFQKMMTGLTIITALGTLPLVGCSNGTAPIAQAQEETKMVQIVSTPRSLSSEALQALPDGPPAEKEEINALEEPTRGGGYKNSPNGFVYPQCTWGADVLTYGDGWRLRFSNKRPRNAINWPNSSFLLNARISTPTVGGLMVLNNSASGHVAWIADVTTIGVRTYVTVFHTNWPYGIKIRDAMYQTSFILSADGRSVTPIYLVNGKVVKGRTVALQAFLVRA